MKALTEDLDVRGTFPSPEDERAPRFDCGRCLDSGFVEAPPIRRHGMEYSAVMPCPSCETGQTMTRSHQARQMEAALDAARHSHRDTVRLRKLEDAHRLLERGDVKQALEAYRRGDDED